MNINSISDFRRAMRNGPYAWPGGYPVYFVCADGEALSFKAARENRLEILHALAYPVRNDGWRVVAMDVNWEDAALFCAHTNERIRERLR